MKEYKFCPLCGNTLEDVVAEERTRKFCPACQLIHYKNPKPTVAAIAEREGGILLIKRGVEPSKGLWTLPSGFMEIGETPEEACLRELQEEAGVSGEIVDLLSAFHEYNDMYGDMINISYYVKLMPGTITAGDDADDAVLMAVDAIKDLGFPSLNHAFGEYRKRYFR